MKKKLKLTGLNVQSFVTALSDSEKQTVNGGGNTNNPVCNTLVAGCLNTHAPNLCHNSSFTNFQMMCCDAPTTCPCGNTNDICTP